jgi:hypothetical protein
MRTAAYLALAIALAPGSALSAPVCQIRSGSATGALLELYTSEGCSSCPPADRWFGALSASADPQRLSLLAFHVDYWDEIGWPDRFARHAYTERQRRRVEAGGSTIVYTPQVMLSSRLDLRWFKPGQVSAALAEVVRKPAEVELRMSAQSMPGHLRVGLQASASGSSPSEGRMYLALYENGLSSVVKAGENAGVTLRHERVVRGLWGPWPVPATGAMRYLNVTPAKNSKLANLGLTAFVQDERTGTTLQALSLPLTGCAMPGENFAAP